jgi:phytoene synthase
VKQAVDILAAKSRSFALAGRLLGDLERDRAAIVYAWCRRADDAIDLAAPHQRAPALDRLHAELDAVTRGEPTGDAVLDAFADVVRDCRIPRAYPAELLAGMAMDAGGHAYRTMDDLLLYAYRVAGTVGLMMCHVLGLRDDRALVRGVHLGIAMQLTNVCRDVLEDWQLGRLYLPDDRLAAAGARDLAAQLGGPFPQAARSAVAAVTRQLLAEADGYYRSADRGISDLPWRAAVAIRTARLVYAAIGARIAAQRHDPLAGRAVVPTWRKVALAARAGVIGVAEIPRRWPVSGTHIPTREVSFARDVVGIRG